jgi:hypothetical protein
MSTSTGECLSFGPYNLLVRERLLKKSILARRGGADETASNVAACKPPCSGQGRTIGVVTLRNSSFTSPEYRSEFVFERSRRNPK